MRRTAWSGRGSTGLPKHAEAMGIVAVDGDPITAASSQILVLAGRVVESFVIASRPRSAAKLPSRSASGGSSGT